MDTRDWIVMGRVDEDPDSTVWDEVLGWLCDVTALTGSMAGSRLPLACRVLSQWQGEDNGIHSPPRQGALCVVVFPSGDPNEDSVILGFLHDADGAGAPATVNGDTIVETGAESGQVAADETFLATIPNLDIDIEARNVRVTGSLILGSPDADQEAVRGSDIADAIEDLADSLVSAVTTVNAAIPTGISDPTVVASLQVAVATFRSARQTYLSSRIKVD